MHLREVNISTPPNRVVSRSAAPPSTSGRLLETKQETERKAYAAAIEALPEAQERPFTAAKIAEAYTAASLPVARAAAILRGLPSEIDELAERVQTRMAAKAAMVENPKVRRKVEIRIAALTHRAENLGDTAARAEARKLGFALATATEARITVSLALAQLDIDPTRFE